MDSILNSVRKKLGGELFVSPEEATPFDDELIQDINSALMILTQIGVGKMGYAITSAEDTWQDFLGDTNTDKELVKTYVGLKVKLMFDPPASNVLVKLIEDQTREYEWRLNVRAESNA